MSPNGRTDVRPFVFPAARYHRAKTQTRHHRRGESRHNKDDGLVGSLVAPVTPDGMIGVDMAADNGVIGVSVTAVIAGPITIAISRVAIAVSGVAVAIAVIRITVAVSIG